MGNWFIGWRVTLDRPAVDAALARAPSGVRVFHPGDRHVTLAFLGGVDEAAARAAWSVATSEARSSLSATLGPVEALGAEALPAFASLVTVHEPVAEAREPSPDELRDRIRAAAGVAPEGRPWLAHTTLARIDRNARWDRDATIAWAQALPTVGVDVTVGPLALYTWAERGSDHLFQVVASG